MQKIIKKGVVDGNMCVCVKKQYLAYLEKQESTVVQSGARAVLKCETNGWFVVTLTRATSAFLEIHNDPLNQMK